MLEVRTPEGVPNVGRKIIGSTAGDLKCAVQKL